MVIYAIRIDRDTSDFNFQNFANFQGIDFHNACTLNKYYEESQGGTSK